MRIDRGKKAPRKRKPGINAFWVQCNDEEWHKGMQDERDGRNGEKEKRERDRDGECVCVRVCVRVKDQKGQAKKKAKYNNLCKRISCDDSDHDSSIYITPAQGGGGTRGAHGTNQKLSINPTS